MRVVPRNVLNRGSFCIKAQSSSSRCVNRGRPVVRIRLSRAHLESLTEAGKAGPSDSLLRDGASHISSRSHQRRDGSQCRCGPPSIRRQGVAKPLGRRCPLLGRKKANPQNPLVGQDSAGPPAATFASNIQRGVFNSRPIRAQDSPTNGTSKLHAWIPRFLSTLRATRMGSPASHCLATRATRSMAKPLPSPPRPWSL